MNIKVKLYTQRIEQDALGQMVEAPEHWRDLWCEPTYSGGSLKTFAGRLASEHQVVLTTHWRRNIDKCRYVNHDGDIHPIDDVVMELRNGMQPLAHIITSTTRYGE